MKSRSSVILVFFWGLVCQQPAFSQFIPSPEDSEWRRLAYFETAGLARSESLVLYRANTRSAQASTPEFSSDLFDRYKLGLEGLAGVSQTQGFPIGSNEGGLWSGVGLSNWSRFLGRLEWNGLAVVLGGWGSWVENQDFVLQKSGLKGQPLADLWGANIDAPQRLGYASFWAGKADVGVSYTNGSLLLSLSTEPLWFGPGLFNSLLLSSNAEGFPHVQLGLEALETAVGRVEVQTVLGRLETSEYWRPNTPTRPRFFGGLFLAYSPVFFPQLTLGFGRTIFSYWDDLDWTVPLTLLNTKALTIDESGNQYTDTGDIGTGSSHQHAGITWRLVFPEAGFETYGEWAKNDFSSLLRLYWTNPDHMQAYSFGMRKTFTLDTPSSLLGLSWELTNAGQSLESLINFNKMTAGGEFYNHWSIKEGYTHRGRALGAGIGNGVAQTFAVDYYGRFLQLGAQLQRLNPYSTYLYYGTLPNTNEYRTDTQYLWTLRSSWIVDSFRLSARLDYNYNFNRYFQAWSPQKNGDETAWKVTLSLGWKLEGNENQ